MRTKRVRIFAGPNGSGKSSVYNHLLRFGDINLGIFVNADLIEQSLRTAGQVDISTYGFVFDFEEFCQSYSNSSFYALSTGDAIKPTLSCEGNLLRTSTPEVINSYFAAFITDYIREAMLDCVDVFTIETVMSHPSKLDYIRRAKAKGYRVYLYFVSTEDPSVNVSRVEYRVSSGGHSVPKDKIVERYNRSLENLYEALTLSDRAYIFDNSQINIGMHTLYAEYNNGTLSFLKETIPYWIDQYIVQRSKR